MQSDPRVTPSTALQPDIIELLVVDWRLHSAAADLAAIKCRPLERVSAGSSSALQTHSVSANCAQFAGRAAWLALVGVTYPPPSETSCICTTQSTLTTKLDTKSTHTKPCLPELCTVLDVAVRPSLCVCVCRNFTPPAHQLLVHTRARRHASSSCAHATRRRRCTRRGRARGRGRRPRARTHDLAVESGGVGGTAVIHPLPPPWHPASGDLPTTSGPPPRSRWPAAPRCADAAW